MYWCSEGTLGRGKAERGRFESYIHLNLPLSSNGRAVVLHATGGGSIPSRGTNWVLKVVRIRQRDCKSRPSGSGSNPPGPTTYSYGQNGEGTSLITKRFLVRVQV